MAARLNRRHQDTIREKIKVSNIIDRLEKHVAGEIELSATQVTSAKILLDKTMSNAPVITENTTDLRMQQAPQDLRGLEDKDLLEWKQLLDKVQELQAASVH